MTRTVLALALGIASPITPAYGGDDVVQLDLVHPRDAAGFVYSLELEGPDHLVGPLYVGKVDLRKDGVDGLDLIYICRRGGPSRWAMERSKLRCSRPAGVRFTSSSSGRQPTEGSNCMAGECGMERNMPTAFSRLMPPRSQGATAMTVGASVHV